MINFITIERLNPTRKQIVEDKMRLRSAYVKHYYFWDSSVYTNDPRMLYNTCYEHKTSHMVGKLQPS